MEEKIQEVFASSGCKFCPEQSENEYYELITSVGQFATNLIASTSTELKRDCRKIFKSLVRIAYQNGQTIDFKTLDPITEFRFRDFRLFVKHISELGFFIEPSRNYLEIGLMINLALIQLDLILQKKFNTNLISML